MGQLGDSDRAAGEALVRLGGRATPDELGRAAGLTVKTRGRSIARMRDRGLFAGDKGRVSLTSAGWDAFLVSERPGPGTLDPALAFLPYRHRCAVEALLGSAIARHHLGGRRNEPYLNLMAVGATATGKTLVFKIACHLLGLDPVRHTVKMQRQTKGTVGGRRAPTSEGMGYSPAPAMQLALVLFDEFDKAPDEAVRREVLPYFGGDVATFDEGRPTRYLPAAMLTANPPPRADRYDQLRGEYRRRSMLLDTGTTQAAYPGLEEGAMAFFAEPRWRGLLRLEDLAPPTDALPPGLVRYLGTLTEALTDAGLELFCGARALESLALGLAPLLGTGPDLRGAAAAAAHHYLAVAESVPGLVLPEWHLQLQALGDVLSDDVTRSALDGALRRRRADEATHRRSLADSRHVEVVLDRQLAGDWSALKSTLADAQALLAPAKLRLATPEQRAQAANLRRQLAHLLGRASQEGGRPRLDELAGETPELLGSARALAERLAADAACRAEEKRRRRLVPAKPVPVRTGPSDEQRAAWVEVLDERRRIARQLEALYRRKKATPGEPPFAVLAELDLLVYEPAPAPVPSSLSGKIGYVLGGRPPPGRWRSTVDRSLTFPGSPSSCAVLDAWGPNTQAVIRPGLASLHAQEDHYAALLGRKRRQGRIVLRAQAPLASGAGHGQPSPPLRLAPASVRELLPGARSLGR